jgi:hypothetical protein
MLEMGHGGWEDYDVTKGWLGYFHRTLYRSWTTAFDRQVEEQVLCLREMGVYRRIRFVAKQVQLQQLHWLPKLQNHLLESLFSHTSNQPPLHLESVSSKAPRDKDIIVKAALNTQEPLLLQSPTMINHTPAVHLRFHKTMSVPPQLRRHLHLIDILDLGIHQRHLLTTLILKVLGHPEQHRLFLHPRD